MAVVKLSTKVKFASNWGKEIDRLIRDFGEKPKTITASLLVKPGYDYWWFVEYGTSPATSSPGPKSSDPVVLSAPASIAGKQYHNHTSPYLIAPKNKWTVVKGKRKRKKLYYVSTAMGKPYKVQALFTHHPGIKPAAKGGVIRMAIFRAQRQMVKQLIKLFDQNTVEREDLVDIVNNAMTGAVTEIRMNFPSDTSANRNRSHEARPRPGAHLSSAFSIKPAE